MSQQLKMNAKHAKSNDLLIEYKTIFMKLGETPEETKHIDSIWRTLTFRRSAIKHQHLEKMEEYLEGVRKQRLQANRNHGQSRPAPRQHQWREMIPQYSQRRQKKQSIHKQHNKDDYPTYNNSKETANVKTRPTPRHDSTITRTDNTSMPSTPAFLNAYPKHNNSKETANIKAGPHQNSTIENGNTTTMPTRQPTNATAFDKHDELFLQAIEAKRTRPADDTYEQLEKLIDIACDYEEIDWQPAALAVWREIHQIAKTPSIKAHIEKLERAGPPRMNEEKCWRILKLPRTASREEIQRAYKQRARETHPDRVGRQSTNKEVEELRTHRFLQANVARKWCLNGGQDPNTGHQWTRT